MEKKGEGRHTTGERGPRAAMSYKMTAVEKAQRGGRDVLKIHTAMTDENPAAVQQPLNPPHLQPLYE